MASTQESAHHSSKRVLMMAGGTGGHVFPALAIAKGLMAEGFWVEWLGTTRGLEAQIVPAAGIRLHDIAVTSWRRQGVIKRFAAAFFLLKALYQSIRILRRFKPQLVIGMGGFAAGPGGIAAWLLGIPLIIHEQNAVAGVTNRVLTRVAQYVLEGFPRSFPEKMHAIWTGNPVREELMLVPPPQLRFKDRSGPIRLFIMGGSQGATALNQLCPRALALIPVDHRPEIWHQAGGGHARATTEAYEAYGIPAKVEAFIQSIDEAYAWADLVLCRAGALTIAELATVGVGSLLIPFPFAVDDHQTHNGRFLEEVGAAQLIQQQALDPTKLAEIIVRLSQDRLRLFKMAEAAKTVAKPKASQEVLAYCKEVLGESKKL